MTIGSILKMASNFKTYILLFLAFAIAISGFVWGAYQTNKLTNLQNKIVRIDTESLQSIRDSLDKIENSNIKIINEIKLRRIKLEELENRLKNKDTVIIDIDEALKIIGILQ